jgi:hypothetical protein
MLAVTLDAFDIFVAVCLIILVVVALFGAWRR